MIETQSKMSIGNVPWPLAIVFAVVVSLTGASTANALPIIEMDPNGSAATAQNVDPFFSLDFDPNIEDGVASNMSTIIPHVTISGTGDGFTFDYYSFTANAGDRVILDTDFSESGSLDSILTLYDTDGITPLIENDDTLFDGPGDVFPFTLNSFIDFTVGTSGMFFVRVADCCVRVPSFTSRYTLHISVENHAVAGQVTVSEPVTLYLFGASLGALGFLRRRQRKSRLADMTL